jgi:glycosyltransferase involved in cell wall biosynthesis
MGLRVLYLTHNVSWKGGGVFYTAYHQARHLVSRGHEVTLLSVSPTSRWHFCERITEGVRIIETPDLLWGKARTGWDPWDTLRRIVRLRKSNYDLIHGFESRPVVALPALYLKHNRRVPTVLTWADWFGRGGKGTERGKWLSIVMDPVETFCEEYFYPRVDWCVAMGEPLSERARSLGVPQSKILNLLHGCDPGGIHTMSINEVRNKLAGLPSEGMVLGYLGVLRPTSAELLFKAFQIIRRQLAIDCKLVLIGNHKLNLQNYLPDGREDVIETGWLSYPAVNDYLAASNLLLLPLRKAIATDNVWPSKLNDYLSVGRPTVATNMRILEPLFEQHQIGILTRDEPDAFAQGCLDLLSDTDKCIEMGANARSLAEGDLSWSRLVDRLEMFYMSIVQANR